MQTRNKVLDDLAQLMSNAMGVAQGAKVEAETAMKGLIDRWLADRNFVTREEFDAVRAMAQKAREENEALKARIAALEAAAASRRPQRVERAVNAARKSSCELSQFWPLQHPGLRPTISCRSAAHAVDLLLTSPPPRGVMPRRWPEREGTGHGHCRARFRLRGASPHRHRRDPGRGAVLGLRPDRRRPDRHGDRGQLAHLFGDPRLVRPRRDAAADLRLRHGAAGAARRRRSTRRCASPTTSAGPAPSCSGASRS